jgi:hypothetical protein
MAEMTDRSTETIHLSDAALALFRLHVERHGQVEVSDKTRETYRELARAGVMIAVSTYAGGPESAYRVTKLGFDQKAELLACVKESA